MSSRQGDNDSSLPPQLWEDVPSSEWDQDFADWLVGKKVIAGIIRLKADGETVDSQTQYHGVIVRVEKSSGVYIKCEGRYEGEELCLPPGLWGFEPASPGHYRLLATDEIIVDPDVSTSWTIVPPKPHN